MGRGRDVLVFRAAWRGVLGRAGADGVWGAARAGRRGRGRQDGARRGGEQASCGVGGRTRTMARIFISSGARALPPKPAARLVPATPAEPFLLLAHLPPAACARQRTPRSRPRARRDQTASHTSRQWPLERSDLQPFASGPNPTTCHPAQRPGAQRLHRRPHVPRCTTVTGTRPSVIVALAMPH